MGTQERDIMFLYTSFATSAKLVFYVSTRMVTLYVTLVSQELTIFELML